MLGTICLKSRVWSFSGASSKKDVCRRSNVRSGADATDIALEFDEVDAFVRRAR